MIEAELLSNVVDLAHYMGAKVAHFRPALTSKGWRTPVQGDGTGFPDCIIITADRRLLIRELKSGRNKPTKEQADWITRFRLAGVDAGVWTPADWPDRIKAELAPARNVEGCS